MREPPAAAGSARLAVLTDGGFEHEGCPQLTSVAARRACQAGARTMNDALVTFN
jgi:hypothetical protein